MKTVKCHCGKTIVLRTMPSRPFVPCPACGLRVPVELNPADFMAKCPKCGRFVEPEALSIHQLACTGVPEGAREQEKRPTVW